uniref:Uncharacterized protein n=1 Tax=Romanomermis culicivorax TaxID=13658 RepID=A0A915K533_ROMCU
MKDFSEDRIRNGIQKLMKSRGTATQGRLDSFFTVSTTSMTTLKRKIEDDSKNKNMKKGTSGLKKKPVKKAK